MTNVEKIRVKNAIATAQHAEDVAEENIQLLTEYLDTSVTTSDIAEVLAAAILRMIDIQTEIAETKRAIAKIAEK